VVAGTAVVLGVVDVVDDRVEVVVCFAVEATVESVQAETPQPMTNRGTLPIPSRICLRTVTSPL
jgi:hypothetical protein